MERWRRWRLQPSWFKAGNQEAQAGHLVGVQHVHISRNRAEQVRPLWNTHYLHKAGLRLDRLSVHSYKPDLVLLSAYSSVIFTLEGVPSGQESDVERALDSFYIRG